MIKTFIKLLLLICIVLLSACTHYYGIIENKKTELTNCSFPLHCKETDYYVEINKKWISVDEETYNKSKIGQYLDFTGV